MKIRSWRISGQSRTFYEVEEICPVCNGLGELYFNNIHEMLYELRKNYSMKFKELREYVKEYRKKGFIICPECSGKGYKIYNF